MRDDLITLSEYMEAVPGNKINKELISPFAKYLKSKGKEVYISPYPVFKYGDKKYEIKTKIISQVTDPISNFKRFYLDDFNTIAIYDVYYLFTPIDAENIEVSFVFRFEIIDAHN